MKWNGFRSGHEWLRCRDDKWGRICSRPVFSFYQKLESGGRVTGYEFGNYGFNRPDFGSVCGVSQWPSNAAQRVKEVPGSTISGGNCHCCETVHGRDSKHVREMTIGKRKGGSDRTRSIGQPGPAATRARQ